MLKDSTFFLLPQGNNKASTEQKLCNYKYSTTDNQDFVFGGCRVGLAIGNTGTFPSGPVTNGPMDGRFLFDFFAMPHLALVTTVTLPARGERHASARPTVLRCRHSREVTIGPVACLSKGPHTPPRRPTALSDRSVASFLTHSAEKLH